MTYEAFKEKLCVEMSFGTETPWMREVGYRPEDKDMGLKRWCELTGTNIDQWIARKESEEAAESEKRKPKPKFEQQELILCPPHPTP